MSLIKLDTGFNIEVDFAISPFHKRLFALIIDWVICWVYLITMNALTVWMDSWDLTGLLISMPKIKC